jgi:hypothetical protein
MEEDPRWDIELREQLKMVFANPFYQTGIHTPRQLATAIQRYGLAEIGRGHYFFNDIALCEQDGVNWVPRHAGKKTWGVVLDLLTELGFDWKSYIGKGKEVLNFVAPAERLDAQILKAIQHLDGLLSEYIQMQKEGQL